ncbi:MAG: hypothetical protein IKY93_06240 [Alistipes sp.]|nr:hypothetical protein [Alistipes sp.]
MNNTLHIIITTNVEEYNYEISTLGIHSTLEGAIDTLHKYLKDRFILEDIDPHYTDSDKTEWIMKSGSDVYHAKIHTCPCVYCNDEVTVILHTTIDKEDKCKTEIDHINESFDDAEDNFWSILHNNFADKVEYNANGLIEHEGNELTYEDWINTNFTHSLKWIALDKNETVHQYLIETRTIDASYEAEEEWSDMEEDDINGLLELFLLYQEMGYGWMINNPSQIHPMLNYWLGLVSKEEFEGYVEDYRQRSSAFFDREEQDETFDAIEASNEVLSEILQSILARR